MSKQQTITDAVVAAMKAGDKERLSILRMLAAALKNAQIEAMHELTDSEAEDIIRRQAKQLADAKIDFEKGGRADLVAQTDAELAVISEYLPKQMDEAEVRAKIAELFANEKPTDIGKAMGLAMKELKGQADGNLIRTVISELLAK